MRSVNVYIEFCQEYYLLSSNIVSRNCWAIYQMSRDCFAEAFWVFEHLQIYNTSPRLKVGSRRRFRVSRCFRDFTISQSQLSVSVYVIGVLTGAWLRPSNGRIR